MASQGAPRAPRQSQGFWESREATWMWLLFSPGFPQDGKHFPWGLWGLWTEQGGLQGPSHGWRHL